MNVNFGKSFEASQAEDAEALTKVAELYYAQGKLADAIAACRQALEVKPDWAAAYVTMGNVQQAQGQIDEAIRFYSEALAFNPDYAEAYANLGSMLYKQGRVVEAVVNYEKAIALKPDFAVAYWNLATAFKQQGRTQDASVYEQKALALNPQLRGVNFHLELGDKLAQQGKLDEAIAAWEQAIALKPDFAEAYCEIGIVQRHQGKFQQAIIPLQKAIELKPDYCIAYQHLCAILRDLSDLAAAREAVHKYNQACGEIDPIMVAIYFISTYQVSGLNQIARDRFLELESKLNQDFKIVKNQLEITALYANFLFSMPYLRDDLEANSQLSRLISQHYLEQVLKPSQSQISHYTLKEPDATRELTIGILSNHFYRHSVGWCSADIIRELSHLTSKVNLYATTRIKTDDYTQVFIEAASKFYLPQSYPNGVAKAAEILAEIQRDEVDILLDLDSFSVPVHAEILCQHPAPACISWLGFDAPYLSSKNYFLCDWHTHPTGREQYYQEQLIRMPDSFVAVSGFKRIPVNRVALRRSYRIGLDQVVYLSVATGRKFNRDVVRSQVAILKQVPNSVLIHKAIGDAEVFKSAYYQACDAEGVGKQRIKFLSRFATEEEHRAIYELADVMLDSYPYNGGTHTLEALWFNLPVVTRSGEQFLSRMGYSFLQALELKAGVSWSWEEYIEWGIKLGKDVTFRKEIQEQLLKSKDPNQLAALWNPKKFAQELYQILQGLLQKGNS